MTKNYYEVLGVSKSASKEEISKAYKNLAKKYHPDISKEKDSAEKFKEVNEAYKTLSDDNKRQQYDTFGSTDGGNPFGSNSGFSGFSGFSNFSSGFSSSDFGVDLDDIFESFGFGFSNSKNQRRRRKSIDIYDVLNVSLDDIYFGQKKEIYITRNVKCDSCDGYGAKNKDDIVNCSKCDGSGVVDEYKKSFIGTIKSQRVCDKCSGKGKEFKRFCDKCYGKCVIKKKERIEIQVPKGITHEARIRVSSKGDYDEETRQYGDLFLTINLVNQKDFEIDEFDLYKKVDIDFIQAILGDEIDIEHFKKTLSVKIPKGCEVDTILRLKGKGLPILNKSECGDLFLKLHIVIPKKITSEQEKILIQYANTLKDKSLFGKVKKFFN